MENLMTGVAAWLLLAFSVAFTIRQLYQWLALIATRDGLDRANECRQRIMALGVSAAIAVAAYAAIEFPTELLDLMPLVGTAAFAGTLFGVSLGRGQVRRFYRRGDQDGEWTNFADFPINVGGKVWPTSEHLFQADKFEGTDADHQATIRLAATPMEAASLGRDRSHTMRSDWNEPVTLDFTGEDQFLKHHWELFAGKRVMLVKDYSMLKAVRLKVRQHKRLQDILLSSGEAVFIEHTRKDAYWGDNGDGTGVNMLGKIIMIVREELRHEQEMLLASMPFSDGT